ncbi:MAG: hypothetical protein J5I90_06435 [Caldilineales bacterium]|nr:hypothetical protein [Caldilineales bacterium]
MQPDISIIRASGRVVGRVEGGVFYRTIRTRHILRAPPALAFEAEVIGEIEAAGAGQMVIGNVDTGRIYRSTLENFQRYCFMLDRGYGPQLALPLSRWNVDEGQEITGPAPVRVEAPHEQLDFFEALS